MENSSTTYESQETKILKSNINIVKILIVVIFSFLIQISFGQSPVDSTDNYYYITQIQDEYYDSLLQERGAESMEGTGFKQYARWKMFLGPRVDNNGSLDSYVESINNYYDSQIDATNTSWEYFGPMGEPEPQYENGKLDAFGKGWVDEVLIDPNNSNIIYAGTHNNGIWQTTDGGSNWYCITEKTPKLNGVTSMEFNSAGDILALTFANISSYSNGLYKGSYDNNNWTWSIVNTNDFFPATYPGKYPRKIIIHPGNDNTMFILTKCYILKTTDAGDNWNIVCDKSDQFDRLWDDDTGFEDIIFDSENPQIMYAGGQIILKSTDGGNTWVNNITEYVTSINGEIKTCKMDSQIFDDEGKVWFFYTYVIGTGDNAVKYFGVTKYNSTTGLYTNLIDEEQPSKLGAGWSKINICVDIDDENLIYIAGLQLFEVDATNHPNTTSLKVTSYEFDDDNYIHDDIRDLLIYKTTSGDQKFLIGCDGGVSRAYKHSSGEWYTDDLSYKEYNGYTELNISELYAVSTAGGNQIAYNCQDIGGFFHNGDKFKRLMWGDGGAVLFDNVFSNYLHYSDNQFSFYIEDLNTGERTGLNLPLNSYLFPLVAKNPINPSETYYGVNELYKFDDIYSVIDGTAPDIPVQLTYADGPDQVPFVKPTDIEISGIDPQKMFVSTEYCNDKGDYQKSIFRSFDHGQTWEDLSSLVMDVNHSYISDIELDPESEDQFWVTFCRSTTSSKVKRLFYNEAISDWDIEPFNSGLEEYAGLPVHEMVIDEITGTKYLATDVGVFKYDEVEEEWINISAVDENGTTIFKQRIVTDIEIDNYNRRLYASTFGGGLWFTELDDCPAFNVTDYEVDETEEWLTPRIMNRNIIVGPDDTLTIKSTVYLHPDSKIIVKRGLGENSRGGRLVIDGGKLTNSCAGNSWQGVEVWGYTDEPQNSVHQGWVYITNKGCIENAKTGILANISSTDEEYRGYTGGVIRANGGVFINNEISIKLENLPDAQSLSDIYRCDFVWNNDFKIPGTSPKYHIELTDYSNFGQPEISACRFLNTRTNPEGNIDRIGIGILSINSTFTAGQLCLNNEYPYPCEDYIGNRFENLEIGIDIRGNNDYNSIITIEKNEFKNNEDGINISEGDYGSPLVSVNECTFNNNVSGLYLNNIGNAEVTSNYFSVAAQNKAHGLYLEGSYGFHVENNYFTCNECFGQSTFGIVTQNTKGPNEIYRNTFENIYCAIEALNQNRDSEGNGLVFRCNEFDQTELDIFVDLYDPEPGEYLGIATNQGIGRLFPQLPEQEDMAGNIFFYNPNSNYKDDLFNNNDCNTFYYYYPINTEVQRLRPNEISTKVIRKDVYYNDGWLFSEGCRDLLENSGGGGSLLSQIETLTIKIDSSQNELDILIDGGNTVELQDEVTNSTPPESLQIYEELLSESPYVSDTVISSSIDKEDVLPNAMIRDIMIANTHSAKSDNLITKLDERNEPMPEYMKAEILEYRDTISEMEKLRGRISNYKLKKSRIFSSLVRNYKFDTITPIISTDSLIDLLTQDSSIFSDYQKAYIYYSNNDFQAAIDVINDIPNRFDLNDESLMEYQTDTTYLNLLVDIVQTDTLFRHPDSIQIQKLYDIYNNGIGMAASFARNMLVTYDTLSYLKPVVIPETNKSQQIAKPVINFTEVDGPNNIKIMPNPSKDYFIVEHNLEIYNHGTIIITNLSGYTIKTIDVNTKFGQQIINTKKWDSGVYIATLVENNKVIQNTKFNVIK